MWSRNWISTSRRKSWKVKGREGARGLIGVRASLCLPLWEATPSGVDAALAAERVMTGAQTRILRIQKLEMQSLEAVMD